MSYKGKAKEVYKMLTDYFLLPEDGRKQICNIVQELELENIAYNLAFDNHIRIIDGEIDKVATRLTQELFKT